MRSFESKFAKSKNSLEMKIPDVKRALVAVRSLQRRNQKSAEAGGGAIESHFELSDGLYVRAMIPQTSTVGLWLGASVMVEYTFEEAIELLTKNHEAALTNLKSTEADIAYLRDQINTTDVNLSQVYNVSIREPFVREARVHHSRDHAYDARWCCVSLVAVADSSLGQLEGHAGANAVLSLLYVYHRHVPSLPSLGYFSWLSSITSSKRNLEQPPRRCHHHPNRPAMRSHVVHS